MVFQRLVASWNLKSHQWLLTLSYIKSVGPSGTVTGSAAATAKLLQSCPTLYDPIDGSPPGSPIPGILQARTLEWVAISFSNAWKWKVKVKSLSHVQLFETPWTAAYQAPLSMRFSRQEDWSGVLLPTQAQFCSIIHWSFGKYWPTKLCKSSKYRPMVWLCKIKRPHSLMSPPISSEKSCKYCEAAKLTVVDAGFPKFHFSRESSHGLLGSKFC